jgi:hypothetical protein
MVCANDPKKRSQSFIKLFFNSSNNNGGISVIKPNANFYSNILPV